MELLVEFLEEDTLHELPSRWLFCHIDVPLLGDDAILNDSRFADKAVDTIGSHHRYGVLRIDTWSHVFLCL